MIHLRKNIEFITKTKFMPYRTFKKRHTIDTHKYMSHRNFLMLQYHI